MINDWLALVWRVFASFELTTDVSLLLEATKLKATRLNPVQ